MKIQVLHDDQGNILSFAVVKSGVTDGLSLVPKKNQFIKVVDMPSIKKEQISSEQGFRQLVETITKHKIDINSTESKLIPKTA
jgi:hypothetical protein